MVVLFIQIKYDNAGNQLEDGRARYEYDAFNRCTKVETLDGNVQINRYDAEGLRHEMKENGELVSFIFRGREIVAEESEKGKIRYIRTGELLASDAEYARTYYHYASDEMGSITHVVAGLGKEAAVTGQGNGPVLDGQGNGSVLAGQVNELVASGDVPENSILNRYEYDAWGNLTVCEETVPNRFRFNGQQYDPVSQQYYLRARYYNPVIGRFTQEDTYRGDGLNLYAYCRNNPVYYVDPSGHAVISCEKAQEHMRNAIAAGQRIQDIDIKTANQLRKWYQFKDNHDLLTPDERCLASQIGLDVKINQLLLAEPGEDLYVGTYSRSAYWNKKTGLNATHTPHHAVQDAVSSVSHGRGITINIRKELHLDTETYGSRRDGLTNRQHLASDVAELRVLLGNAGYDRSVINAQLNELIRQNKALGGFEK